MSVILQFTGDIHNVLISDILDTVPVNYEIVANPNHILIKVSDADATRLEAIVSTTWKAISDDEYHNRMIASAESNKDFVIQVGANSNRRSYPRHTKVNITK